MQFNARDPSELTDNSLLAAVRSGDGDGWTRFVDLYGPLIYSWCRRTNVPEPQAADVTQQVFTKVFASIATFQASGSPGAFRSWLRTITRNTLIDYFRSEQGKAAAMGGTAAWQRINEAPAEALSETADNLASEVAALARRALQLIAREFSLNIQQVFDLTVVQNRTAAEAAQVLGMSSTAVRQAKSRLLRRLREELGEVV